jgi:hypothetical protein
MPQELNPSKGSEGRKDATEPSIIEGEYGARNKEVSRPPAPRQSLDQVQDNLPAPSIWSEAGGIWLKNFEADLAERRKNRTGELASLGRRESIVFALFVLAAIMGLLLTPFGIILIVFSKATVGTLSSVTGIFSGSGSVMLRATGKRIETQRSELRNQEREDRRIQYFLTMAILTSDDEQRSQMMRECAAMQIDLMGHEAGISNPKNTSARRRQKKIGKQS